MKNKRQYFPNKEWIKKKLKLFKIYSFLFKTTTPETTRLLPKTFRCLPETSRLLPGASRLLPETSRLLPGASRLLPETSRLALIYVLAHLDVVSIDTNTSINLGLGAPRCCQYRYQY